MAGKKVLPVEDEAAIREMVVMTLERAGFQITEAGHAEQGERALADGLPDLILLDRMLPYVRIYRRAAQPDGDYAGAKPFGEETARIIDAEVQRIINESHEQAKSLLKAHRKELDALVDALLARETLGEEEILEVTGLPPAPPLETRPLAMAGGE